MKVLSHHGEWSHVTWLLFWKVQFKTFSRKPLWCFVNMVFFIKDPLSHKISLLSQIMDQALTVGAPVIGLNDSGGAIWFKREWSLWLATQTSFWWETVQRESKSTGLSSQAVCWLALPSSHLLVSPVAPSWSHWGWHEGRWKPREMGVPRGLVDRTLPLAVGF